MLRLYRPLVEGEFIVAGGDCAQGGIDDNWVQFISKDQVDVPLVLQMPGVAATMTPVLHQTLEWIYDQTKVRPVIALERNMGGASEMERLFKMNRLNKYVIYIMRTMGKSKSGVSTGLFGYNTDSATRPRIVGDLKEAIDAKALTIYDSVTNDQLQTFIVNNNGKPEADANTHDDAVMSLGIAYQLYQTETKPVDEYDDGADTSGNITSLWD